MNSGSYKHHLLVCVAPPLPESLLPSPDIILNKVIEGEKIQMSQLLKNETLGETNINISFSVSKNEKNI